MTERFSNAWTEEVDRLKAEIERLKEQIAGMRENKRYLENDLALKGMTLEQIEAVLDGETVCDFALSFPLIQRVADMKAEIATLKGAIAADDERLVNAAKKAGMVYFGCDTADHLVDMILELKVENAELIQTSGELCPICGWRFIIPDEGCYYCHHYVQKEVRRVVR